MTKLYLFECGTLKSQKHLFTLNKDVDVPFEAPVPFYLIQHNGKNILFDTGNALGAAINPEKHWGEVIKEYYPNMREDQFAPTQLKNILGIEPDKIDYVILSHLHLDHAGAVGAFENASYITHKKEYDWAFSPENNQKGAYIMADIDKDVNWVKLEQELPDYFDLFNDGVIKIYPTFGHTPGHLSVLVDLKETGPVFLTSDSCYTKENLNENIPPGLFWDEKACEKSLSFIKELQNKGAKIFVGHDPIDWRNLKKAPQYYL